ncbi:MAG: hypothetical protein QOF51_3985, partial [Chloroflexota bacterium]|nr:hypothetical protein [Chloroflexota bacterium]
RERDARIHVLTGPVMLVDDKGENPILKWLERGLLTSVHHLPYRAALNPFLVVETSDSYQLETEMAQSPLLPLAEGNWLDSDAFTADERRERAQYMRYIFEGWQQRIKKSGVPHMSELPILLDMSALADLCARTQASERLFDYLEPEALLSLLGS